MGNGTSLLQWDRRVLYLREAGDLFTIDHINSISGV